jgi:hypothetical protein
MANLIIQEEVLDSLFVSYICCYVFFIDFDDIFLLKYSSSGSLLWTRETGSTYDDQGIGVAVSADGSSIYVTGFVSSNLNGEAIASAL